MADVGNNPDGFPESYTELKYDNLKEHVRWAQIEAFEMVV